MPAFNSRQRTILCLFAFISLIASPKLWCQHSSEEDRVERFNAMKENPKSVSDEDMSRIYQDYVELFLHSNPDTAISMYQDMVEFGQRIGNDDVIAQGYSSIAFMYKLRGDVDAHISTAKRVLDFHHDTILLTLTMGDIGTSYLSKINFDSAHYYIDSAFVLSAHVDSIWRSTAYFHKCQLLLREKKHSVALDVLLQCLPFIPENNGLRRAEVFQRIAQIYRTLGDLDKAIEYELRCLKVSEDNNFTRSITQTHTRVGKLYYLQGKDSLAQVHLNASIPTSIERGYHKDLVTSHSILAILDLDRGEAASAKKHIQKADTAYSKVSFKDNREEYYTAKIRLLVNDGNIAEALSWIEQFLDYAAARNSTSSELKANIELRSLYARRGRWQQANALADTIRALEAQMVTTDQKQLVYDLEAKYQSDLKNAEIQRLKNERLIALLEMEKQRRQVWGLIGGLILAFMAILGVWYAYRTKKRVNDELTKLNTELGNALDRNNLLIKEIHHRVKNNLQVVSSLLNLQGKFETDESVLKAINTSKDRVQSISLLHKTLYNNQDLTSVQVRPYFNELLEHLVNSYMGQDNELDLRTRIGNFELDIDTLVPLGLIVNELVTNAFKYAFLPGNQPTLDFTLVRDGNIIRMEVHDNGPGLPVNSIPRRSRSLGMQLIYSFAERLEGDVQIDNSNGCKVTMTFETESAILEQSA